jgi:hypothetical protein
MGRELTSTGNSRDQIPSYWLGSKGRARVTPRRSWRQTFAAAGPSKRDILIELSSPNAFDGKEWTW